MANDILDSKLIHILLILICILFFSCKPAKLVNEQTNVIQKYIDSNLDNIPKHTINLDHFPEYELHQRMTIESALIPDSDVFINKPFDCMIINDTLYVTDFDNHYIIVIFDTKIIRKFGRDGKGPSEFYNPMNIATDNSRIAIANAGTISVKLFDNKFEYLTSFPARMGSDICFYNDKLFINSRQPSRILVKGYNTTQPYSETGNYIPNYSYKPKHKWLPGGNGIHFTIMKSGDILLTYTCTPYLFRYDSLCNLKDIIEMEGEEIDSLHQQDLPSGYYRTFIKSMHSQDSILFVYGNNHLYSFIVKDKIQLIKKHILPKSVTHIKIFDDKVYALRMFDSAINIYKLKDCVCE